jgi:hypothetical protein
VNPTLKLLSGGRVRRRRTSALPVLALSVVLLSGCGGMDHSGAAGGDTSGMEPGTGMAGMAGMAMDDGDGLSATREGYTLTAVKAPRKPGGAGTLSFVILGPTGKPHKDYTLQQTKLMHTYLVRRDLSNYQHVHPTINQTTGVWSVPITVAAPGPYHLLTEFEALTPERDFAPRKLGKDFTVPGPYKPAPYKASFGRAEVAGYQLAMDPQASVGMSTLTLTITRGGAGVTDLQPYLASYAHITGFRKTDLKAVHMHPNENPPENAPAARGGPTLTMSPHFSEPGDYRLFVQFQTADQVKMTPLDIKVM